MADFQGTDHSMPLATDAPASDSLKLWCVPMDQLLENCRLARTSTDSGLLAAQFDWLLEPYSRVDFRFWYSRGVWRARFCQPIGFLNFEDMGPPPPEKTIAGRLNEAGEPILYGSLHNRIALQEIGAGTGDHVQLVNYCIDSTVKLRCCVLGEFLTVHRTGRSWVDDDLTESLNNVLNQIPPDAGNSILYLDGFMSEILRDKDAAKVDYLHSRTLASRLFANCPEVDAVLYPSVEVDGGKNLAIRPTVAAKVLSVASSTVIRITHHYDYGLFDFEPLWIAHPPWNGTSFRWRRPPAVFKWEPEKYLAMEAHTRATRQQSA